MIMPDNYIFFRFSSYENTKILIELLCKRKGVAGLARKMLYRLSPVRGTPKLEISCIFPENPIVFIKIP